MKRRNFYGNKKKVLQKHKRGVGKIVYIALLKSSFSLVFVLLSVTYQDFNVIYFFTLSLSFFFFISLQGINVRHFIFSTHTQKILHRKKWKNLERRIKVVTYISLCDDNSIHSSHFYLKVSKESCPFYRQPCLSYL